MPSPTAPVSEPIGPRTFLLAVLVSILWGGNLVSIRVGVDSVPPLWSAFWRTVSYTHLTLPTKRIV